MLGCRGTFSNQVITPKCSFPVMYPLFYIRIPFCCFGQWARAFRVKQDRDNERGGVITWEGSGWACLSARGFVCFPVGQIYLGGRLSEVCRWKLATSRACYTVTDSYSVMRLLRRRLQPNEKLISFICRQWQSMSCMNHHILSRDIPVKFYPAVIRLLPPWSTPTPIRQSLASVYII